jgi:phospholipid/cholesterol/gamma-HCH transport system substrate-binding protein
MDLHYKREVTVGAMVLLGAALFVVITSWLSGRGVGPGERALIEFADASGLKRGSPVRVSGMGVGRVETIELMEYGRVRLTVSLDEEIVPRADATASVVAVGLAGDVAVELFPGTAAEPLAAGQVIPGESGRGMMEIGADLATRAGALLDNLNVMLDTTLVTEMHGTLRSLQRVLATFGDARNGPAAEMSATLVSLRSLTARVDSTLGSPALQRSLANVDTLSGRLVGMTSQFTTTGARLDSLLTRINSGQGTIGKAMTDDGLYDDIRSATQAFQQLLDEIKKNPGKITIQVRIF